MTPLVLLPGLACDAELFRDQLAPLASRVPVHVADVHRRADSIADMAALLLAEHAGPLRLAGVSMGGIVALEAFAQARQRVEALALLGTTARPDTPEMVGLRTTAIGLFEQGRADEVLRANVPLAFHASRQRDTALVDAYLRMTLERAGGAELARQNRALLGRADRRALLPAIACPLLVMCGDADALTPPECSREIAAAVPHARYVELSACGHMLTWERPAEVTAALLDWLGQGEAPAGACRRPAVAMQSTHPTDGGIA